MPIEYFKNKARFVIGGRCLLQLDRYERALFFSDFPRLKDKNLEEKLNSAGFNAQIDNGFALISPNGHLINEFINKIAPQPLPKANDSNIYMISCVNILRMHKDKASEEDADTLIKLMHILNRKDFRAACAFLMNRLAVSLREHKSTPVSGAELLLFSYNKTRTEE
jgi:hypothetical protein